MILMVDVISRFRLGTNMRRAACQIRPRASRAGSFVVLSGCAPSPLRTISPPSASVKAHVTLPLKLKYEATRLTGTTLAVCLGSNCIESCINWTGAPLRVLHISFGLELTSTVVVFAYYCSRFALRVTRLNQLSGRTLISVHACILRVMLIIFALD